MAGYQLTIKLENINTPVKRKLIVPTGINFKRLSDAIVLIFGWKKVYNHEFFLLSQARIMTSNKAKYDEYKENYQDYLSLKAYQSSNILIDRYFKSESELTYLLISDEVWEHKITIEDYIEDYNSVYPLLINYEGENIYHQDKGIAFYNELSNYHSSEDARRMQKTIKNLHPELEKYDHIVDESSLYNLNLINVQLQDLFFRRQLIQRKKFTSK